MAKTILIIEDETAIQNIVRAFLEDAGYTVYSAGDGLEGIETFRRCNPDLVLLDLMLCALLGIICRQDHIATLVCGVIWLIILLTRSLLRFPGLEYVYLFIRFAGDQNNIWLWNKGIITLAGLFLWCVIYWKCKRVD